MPDGGMRREEGGEEGRGRKRGKEWRNGEGQEGGGEGGKEGKTEGRWMIQCMSPASPKLFLCSFLITHKHSFPFPPSLPSSPT